MKSKIIRRPEVSSYVARILLALCILTAAVLPRQVLADVPVSDGVQVDDRLKVKLGGLRFNRLNGSFDTLARVTNTSSFPVYGPISIVVTNLAPSVASLSNADGVDSEGRPYVSVPITGTFLAPGRSVRDIPLQFTYSAPSSVPLSFDLEMQGVPVVLLTPGSTPFSLKAGVETEVVFTVQSLGMDPAAKKPLQLIPQGSNVVLRDDIGGAVITELDLNDDGIDGDASADDGLFSGRAAVDTSGNLPSELLLFRTQVDLGGELQSSPEHSIQVTNLPTDISASNLNLSNLLDSGEGVALVGNEILIWFKPEVPEEGIPGGDFGPPVIGVDTVIDSLVSFVGGMQEDDSIVGTVVGTNLHTHLYQVAFTRPVDGGESGFEPVSLSVNDMTGMIAWLLDVFVEQVDGASANPVGTLATASTCGTDGDVALSTENINAELPALEQQAIWRINAPPAWDMATGQGVTVTVLDSGADLDHNALLTALTGLSVDDTLVGNNFEGHGTGVAGIIAARKEVDASGILGVAKGAMVQALQMPSNNVGNSFAGNDTYSNGSDLISVLTNELNQSGGGILSVSMGGNWDIRSFIYGYAVLQICKSIEEIVWDQGDPANGIEPHARAIILAAAGNGGSSDYFYPAQCNEVISDTSSPKFNLASQVVHKELLVAVASTRTENDLLYESEGCGSNYGPWVDVLAPGHAVLTTKNNGGYERRTGTSFATPMVAGAAALLKQRGVELTDIQAYLKDTAAQLLVNGDGGPIPGPDPRLCDPTLTDCAGRIDVQAALLAANHATPPVCDIEIPGPNENITISAGAQVFFRGSAVDPHGSDAMTYAWDFGAETTPATSDKLSPGYVVFDNTSGEQTFIEVTMTVTDEFGAQCTTEPRLIAVEPIVSFLNVSASSAAEGDDVIFTVERSGELPAGQTFNYAVNPGTALDGIDYTGIGGTLIFAADETSKTIPVSSLENEVAQGNRSFSLVLSDATNGLSIETETAEGSINDDDVVSFVVDSASGPEGDASGANSLEFTVSRLIDAPGTVVSVDFATSDGDAVAGSDYVADSGTLQFAPGVFSLSVIISLEGDLLHEADESFNLELNNPATVPAGTLPAASVTVGVASAQGTIENDDDAPLLSISAEPAPAGNEGEGIPVRVQRDRLSGAVQTVELQAYVDLAAGDTASATDLDPAAASILVTFQPTDSFVDVFVPSAEDEDTEPAETFTVALVGPPNFGDIDPTAQSITATILDDELEAGDVNGDGRVDAGDLVLATRIVNGSYAPSADQRARLDLAPVVAGESVPDGKLNAADLLILQRLLMEQEPVGLN